MDLNYSQIEKERYGGELYFLQRIKDNQKSMKQYDLLNEINYDCCLINNILKVSISQTFEAYQSLIEEAIYNLDLGPNSCLDSFTAQYNSTLIKGIIKGKEQAQQNYQESIRQGDIVTYANLSSFQNILGESNKITFCLGNIPPNTQLKIKIVIIKQAKSYLNRYYTVTIPLLKTANDMRQKEKIKSQEIDYPQKNQILGNNHLKENNYFKLDVYSTGRIIIAETNQLYALEDLIDSNHRRFTLSEQFLSQNNLNFTFIYQYSGMFEPQIIFGKSQIFNEDRAKQAINPQRRSAMISFLPDFNQNQALQIESEVYTSFMVGENIFGEDYLNKINSQLIDHLATSKTEFLFFLDRSYSMENGPIQKAIQSLQFFLKSLPIDSYFNIVSFGSTYQMLFQSSLKYNSENLDQAIAIISEFDATMGSTNIFSPLEYIFQNQQKIPQYNRQIFLLTDGKIENFENTINLIKKYNNYNRVHAIGIGDEISTNQIFKIANAGKGQSKIIKFTNRLSEEIISMLEQSLSPVLDDFQIDYDKTIFELEKYPIFEHHVTLKDESINIHLFFKQGICVEDLTEKQKTISLSYYDSTINTEVRQQVILNPLDVFEVNEELQSQIFKLGKYLYLNDAINLNQIQEDYIIKECIDYQILTEKSAVICVIEKANDEKRQYYESIKLTNLQQQLINSNQNKKYTMNKMQQQHTKVKIVDRPASILFTGNSSNTNRPMTSCRKIDPSQIRQQNALNYDYHDEEEDYVYHDEEEDYVCLAQNKQGYNPYMSQNDYNSFQVIQSYNQKSNYEVFQNSLQQQLTQYQNVNSSYFGGVNLEHILSLVQYNGVWEFNINLVNLIINYDHKQIQEILNHFNDRNAFMTLAFLVFLENRYNNESKKWILIQKKSIKFVQLNIKQGINLNFIKSVIKSHIKN